MGSDSATSKSNSVEAAPLNRAGFYAAIATTLLTAVTFTIAFLTPPLSGPLCQANCFEYPFAGIESRFPRDYYWMYPAILLSMSFLVLVSCVHEAAAPGKKALTRSAFGFAILSSGILIATYFTQVSVIQPSLLRGEKDGIALLSQYNPHGLFIALEELGFLLLSLALFFIAPAFPGMSRAERALRWILPAGFVFSVGALILITWSHGIQREYLFELAVISINWLALLVAGPLLAFWFYRRLSKR